MNFDPSHLFNKRGQNPGSYHNAPPRETHKLEEDEVEGERGKKRKATGDCPGCKEEGKGRVRSKWLCKKCRRHYCVPHFFTYHQATKVDNSCWGWVS